VIVAAKSSSTPHGFGLIEVMISMALLVTAAVGVLGLAVKSAQMNFDGRRITRAAALAQDLVANIDLWAYDDPRLTNSVGGNDLDIGDAEAAFEQASIATTPDHTEADLTADGALWLGVPQAAIVAGGYERYWNVSEGDDWNGNLIPDAKRIAVIIRWPQGAGFRSLVLYTTKINPADSQ
jgi:prepilin-type N-terminal cleavage/methylation domain-containing protein